jgi:hypothetical protein
MVRLKFAIFAVAVLAVWVWHLYALAPSLGARAVAAAKIQVARAPAGLAVQIDERRREFHRAALKVASAPSALAALRNRAEPPGADKLAPVRAAAMDEIPEAYRAALVIALSNEHGSVYARGSAEPVSDPKDFNVAALGQAGAEGLWQEAFGSTHLFFSFPVAAFERGEPKLLGYLVLGAPLQVDRLLDAAAKEVGLGAIALLQGGKQVSIAGPQKPPTDKLASLGMGKTDVVVRGAVNNLAFFHFPLATSGDIFGGRAPLWVGSRQVIRSTPYEMIGYATTRQVMEPLAEYQQATVLLFFALFGAALAVGLLIEPKGYRAPSRRAHRAEVEAPAYEAFPPASALFGERASQSTFHPSSQASSLAEEPPPLPATDAGADSGLGASSDEALFAQPRSDDSVPYGAPPADAQPAPADGYGAYVEDNQPTMAYPSPLLPDDAFAQASGHPGASAAPSVPEDTYPEATRIQEVPEELIRASARPQQEREPPPEPPPRPMPIVQSAAPNDEPHFREVFRDFLAAREKCGEAAEGLTYDRFAQKLRKNRDQLMEKYSCRTVRFQVYVKEGKAALKATPIKG